LSHKILKQFAVFRNYDGNKLKSKPNKLVWQERERKRSTSGRSFSHGSLRILKQFAVFRNYDGNKLRSKLDKRRNWNRRLVCGKRSCRLNH